ncbi:hypothetical protein GQ457_07G002160 [Hibiscus cannabinus]
MQVGFGCYSNRSDSVPGQHQSVTDRVRVIAASEEAGGGRRMNLSISDPDIIPLPSTPQEAFGEEDGAHKSTSGGISFELEEI